jgi:Tfp pilus assembly protein PilN
MIRINLLIGKRKKRRMKGPQNVAIVLIAVNLAALVVSGAVTVWVNGKSAQLRDESEANKSVIGALTKKIDEINKIDRLNKELEQRSMLIEALRKNQSVPVRVLDEVGLLIPDGVWLNALFFKDNVVSLEGTSFSNSDIVSFMDNLKRSADLADVYLEESREGEIDKVRIYQFRAHFKVKV